MHYGQIKQYDSSFTPHSFQLEEDFEFETLSSLDFLWPKSISFLKNEKILKSFLSSYQKTKYRPSLSLGARGFL